MKRNPLTLIIGLLLIIIFGLLLFVFQVRTTDVAVVTTFGKPDAAHHRAGAYLKWPWPIQKVWTFDRRTQNFEDRLTEGLTQDSFNLLTSVYVGWKVSDPTAFFPRSPAAPIRLRRRRRSWTNGWAPPKPRLWAGIPWPTSIDERQRGQLHGIEKEILDGVQSQLRTNNLGLQVEFLGIKRLQLPESVSQPVFDRMTSERKVLADRFQYEGEAEAQRIRSTAERRAAELLANAQGQATADQGQGGGRSRQVLEGLPAESRAGQLLFRLTALEDSLKDRSTLIFDQHTPPFDLFQGVSTNRLTK